MTCNKGCELPKIIKTELTKHMPSIIKGEKECKNPSPGGTSGASELLWMLFTSAYASASSPSFLILKVWSESQPPVILIVSLTMPPTQ